MNPIDIQIKCLFILFRILFILVTFSPNSTIIGFHFYVFLIDINWNSMEKYCKYIYNKVQRLILQKKKKSAQQKIAYNILYITCTRHIKYLYHTNLHNIESEKKGWCLCIKSFVLRFIFHIFFIILKYFLTCLKSNRGKWWKIRNKRFCRMNFCNWFSSASPFILNEGNKMQNILEIMLTLETAD